MWPFEKWLKKKTRLFLPQDAVDPDFAATAPTTLLMFANGFKVSAGRMGA